MTVARRLGGVHLVSADSMQVYRRMDIGTAKPTPAEQAEVPHHCIDLVDPTVDFTVAAYKTAHSDALADIEAVGCIALIVGGTGLYHRVVIDDFDLPGEWPAIRAELDGHADTAALHERLAVARPGGGLEDRTVESAPRRAGARGDARQRPAVQLVRPGRRLLPADERGADRYPPPPARSSAS